MTEASPADGAMAAAGSRHRLPWWTWIAVFGAAAFLGLLVFVAGLNIWPMLGIGTRTFGTIYVDSPQVYTRERLVNDRFRQEAWLVLQLNRTDELMDDGRFDGVEGRRISNVTRLLNAAASLDEKQNSEDVLSTVKEATRKDLPSISAAPIEAFHDAQTYREVVRTELMSTQLDDRHDIEGNTLYRLDFDAAIAPGNNTTAAAVVQVTLEEEWSPQNYMNLYADWHAHLQTEIESAVGYQTLDLLQWGQALDEIDKLVLRESVERQICAALAAIINTKEKMQQGINKDLACPGIERWLLQDSIGHYVSEYMTLLKEQNNLRFVLAVADQLETSNVKVGEIPIPLPEAIQAARTLQAAEAARSIAGQDPGARPGKAASSGRPARDADEGNDRDRRDDIARAVSFVDNLEGCRVRGQERRENGRDAEAVFSLPGTFGMQLGCPQQLRPHEPLLGAITMLERLQRLQQSDTGAEVTVELVIERIKPRNSGQCHNEMSNFDMGICKNPVPAVDPNFVQRVVAQTVLAKLNDELDSIKVANGIKSFFIDTPIRGCELNACSLILVPGKPLKTDECERKTGNRDDPYWCKLHHILRERAAVFSYAVTPTQMVQRIGSEDATRMSLEAALRAATQASGADFDAKLRSLYDFDERIEVRHRHPIVVGFGAPHQEEPTDQENPQTVFGWVVRPRFAPRMNGQEESVRHVTQHYPLSAVVSVPSWWRGLKLTVRTAWIDSDDDWLDFTETRDEDKFSETREEDGCGTEQIDRNQTCRFHFVQVPGSVKEISHKLKYEVRKEPYLASNAEPTALFQQVLQVGKPGEIILQGGRLWRSTVVTVGQQRADRIVVLPDMNGVIAEFTCVRPPQNGEAEQFVTVWTSEGSTRAPLRVRVDSNSYQGCSDDTSAQ
jgi:hypothetical protein